MDGMTRNVADDRTEPSRTEPVPTPSTWPLDAASTAEPVRRAIEPRSFRDALGRFATGVTVVTARHPVSGPIGMTANSFNSVSLDPPLVLFSIANTARRLAAFLEAPGFVVNVLGLGQEALARRFAAGGPDMWDGLDIEPGRFGAPVLPGTIAAFDCLHHGSHEGGDHRILVGRVVAMEHDGTGEPLLYFGGRFRTLAPDQAPR